MIMNERDLPSRLFTLVLGVLAVTAGFAQGPVFGLKAGANISNLVGEDIDDQKGRFGFNAGVMARSEPEDPIGVQAELLYTTKGTEVHYNGLFGVDQNTTFQLGYLELPLMASFRFGPLFELQAGAYAAYLLSSDISTEGDLGSGSEELDRDNFQSVDIGLVAGAAVNVGPAQIGARYDYGLSHLADSDGAELVLGDARNACFQVYVGIGLMNTR